MFCNKHCVIFGSVKKCFSCTACVISRLSKKAQGFFAQRVSLHVPGSLVSPMLFLHSWFNFQAHGKQRLCHFLAQRKKCFSCVISLRSFGMLFWHICIISWPSALIKLQPILLQTLCHLQTQWDFFAKLVHSLIVSFLGSVQKHSFLAHHVSYLRSVVTLMLSFPYTTNVSMSWHSDEHHAFLHRLWHFFIGE